MFENLWDRSVVEVLLKLGVAVVLGGAIGWERDVQGHPAGVRTHMLLVLGVVLFTEVSRQIGGDPGRIAAQIVTGVGFLCAGAILRVGMDVKGLTTAASLWGVSAIGMAVSMGGPFLTIAVCATILSLFTLSIVQKAERKFIKSNKKRVIRIVIDSREVLYTVLEQFQMEHRWTVESVRIVEEGAELAVEVELYGKEGALERTLLNPHVKSAFWVDS